MLLAASQINRWGINSGMWKLGVVLVIAASPASATPFDDCILEHTKGIRDARAITTIHRACKEKTLPQRCRAECAELQAKLDALPKQPSYEEWMAASERKQPGFRERYEFEQTYAYWQKTYGTPLFDIDAEVGKCINQCLAESAWNRRFGDCAP